MPSLLATLASMDKTGGHRELYARFKVDRHLGKGTLGTVYAARSLCDEDGAQVAIKEIEVKQLSPSEKDAAAEEIIKLKDIDHPCVTPIYDVFTDRTTLCIVMGYAKGTNLAQLIAQGATAGRTMQEPLIWKYFIQACKGLSIFHYSGILHRNIKPSNMYITSGQRLQIGEPGMVELLRGSKSQTALGTPKYLAPEVWQGHPFSFSGDIWALGCVLYEMCTYKVPFEARNVQELRSKVCRGRFAPISARFSPELAKVVYSLLSIDPMLRPNIDQILSSPVIKHYSNILFQAGSDDPAVDM